jgi:PAS domain S-box-containing protein
MASELEAPKSSLRNNIMIVFFLVITIWGVAINTIFQHVLQRTLVRDGVNKTAIENIARDFTTIGTGITITGIFIVLSIGVLLSKTITRPIEELTRGVMEVAGGKLDVKVDITSQDEIGQLADSFNKMAEERKQAEEALRESENKFRDLSEKSVVGVYLIQDGVFKYVNPRFAEIFDYSVGELIDVLGPNDLPFPKDWPLVEENLRKRMSGQAKSSHYGFRGIKKDGETIYVDVYGSRTMYQGRPAIIGTLLDITERRKADEELIESEQRFRAIFDYAMEGILLVDIEKKKFFTANNMFLQMLGYTLDEIGDIGLTDIYPEKDQAYVTEQFERQLRGESTLATDIPVKRKDGSVFYAEINSSPITLVGKEYMVQIYRDITERKRMEEKLRESRDFVQTVIDSIADPTLVIDSRNYHIVTANHAVRELAGGEDPAAEGLTCYQISHHRDRPCDGPDEPCPLDEVLSTKSPVRLVHTHYDREGKELIVDIIATPILDREGQVAQVVESCRDITELKRMEGALRASEETYRTVFESTGTAMVIIEEDTIISMANREFSELSGYSREEIEGKKSWTEFVAEEDLESMRRYHRLRRDEPGKVPTNYEFSFLTRDGSVREIFLTVAMIPGTKRSVASLLDITARKRAEERTRRYMEDLERFAKAAAGREERIAELKERARELEGKKLGYKECVT